MKRYDSYKPSNIAWLGEIPSHWKTIRIKYLFSEIEDRNENLNFPLLSFSRKRGIVPFSEINEKQPSAADLSKYKIVRSGQLLENRMQAWSGMFAKSEIEGCVSPDYSVFSANNADICVDYYAHLFRTNNYIAHWSNLSRGIGDGFNRLYTNQFHSVVAIFPPLYEQKKIVEYLSEKIALIDEQQADIAKEIVLLQELKQAEIANAVTHGLNPDVKMKESGIPWLGKFPEHWKKLRYKDLLIPKDIKVGQRKELQLLSLTKKGVIVREISEGKGKFPKDFENYKEVKAGDIIFCLFDVDETPRTVGISSYNGMITGAYDVFEIKNVIPDFLLYSYISFDDQKSLKSLYKGMRKVIPLPSLFSAYFVIPPIEEQKAIVEYIKQKTSAIDEMIAKLKSQSEFLTEYRQRLIADVVTGQVKVD